MKGRPEACTTANIRAEKELTTHKDAQAQLPSARGPEPLKSAISSKTKSPHSARVDSVK